MTPKEANKVLEMFLHKQCDLKRTEFAYNQNEVYQAVNMANDALEKQIPKKPRTNDDNWFCCRNCGETFSLVNTLHKRNKYCGECGTALDWGDCK